MPKLCRSAGVLNWSGDMKEAMQGMIRFSKREWILVVLVVVLVAGWVIDHRRHAGVLRRTAESEQYFKQRLFESFGYEFTTSTSEESPKEPKN